MKTTNKMRMVWMLCLALPAVAGITHGPADGKVTCDAANGKCSSDTRLGVGPGPGAGDHTANPADFGMCGVLHLAGSFDSSTVERIVVGSDDYYHVQLAWTGSPTSGPQLEWTCVLFSDFTGLPYEYLKGLGTYAAPTVTAKGGGKATNMLGPNDACIWAGLAGPLSTTDRTQAAVSAQFDFYDGAFTLSTAQSAPKTTLSTYAFCNGIDGFPWTPFLNNMVVPGLTSTGGVKYNVTFPVPGGKDDPGVISKRWWCYMDGAGTSAGRGKSAAEKFSFAGLGFVTSDTYFFEVGNESALWFNCMGLDQAPPMF